MAESPTTPPENPLSNVVERNIQALVKGREERRCRRTAEEKVVDAITSFAGSTWFVYLHAIIVVIWFAANTGHLGIRPWDPYPFVMLAMAASVEAIFVSTFVLIGQNRQSAEADRRADLDLQINLLAEHEVTRLITLTEAIAEKLGIDVQIPDLAEIKRDIDPQGVERQIILREEGSRQE
jgi:uncharacterized membrane protein